MVRSNASTDHQARVGRPSNLSYLLCLHPLPIPTGLSALCTHPWAPSLTCLDLRDCQLGGEGLNALAACPATPALTSLSLSHNALKGEVVGQALAKLVEVGEHWV